MNDATLSAPSGESRPFQPASVILPALPGFVLLEEIGRGGMGIVYRARDTVLEREVAIKVLLEKYTPDSGVAQRFLDEVRITGQLQHPGIPAVYQVGSLPNRRPYLAMKLIKGDTLESRLKAGTVQDILGIFEAVAQAVGYAHAHDVIHRDLKPSNIMLGAFGEVQVMDWGLAKVLVPNNPRTGETRPELAATIAATEIRTLRDSDGSYTQAGSILGTPAYMAPEQAASELEKIDTRADVFGLGAILCVMLTGKPPFSGETAEAVRLNAMRGNMQEALQRLHTCQADPDVIALCRRCLAFDPAQRPATANDVAEAVSSLRRASDERARQAELAQARAEVQAAEQQHRRRVWLGLAATMLVGLLLALGLGVWAYVARNQAEDARKAEGQARQDAQIKERLASVNAQKAQDNERRALANEKIAKDQAALATAFKNFLQQDLLRLASPHQQQSQRDHDFKMDPDMKVRDLVIRASKQIEGKFADQPLLDAEIRSTLGTTLCDMGRADLALHHLEQARSIYSGLLGQDHLLTLASLQNLSVAYDLVGRHADAMKLCEELVQRKQRTLGRDHIETLSSMNALAFSYSTLGRHEEALKLYEEVLPQLNKILGPDHEQVLGTMNNMALTLVAVHRDQEALKLRKEALDRTSAALGPDHLDSLTMMHNLARSYTSLGRKDDALKLHDQAYQGRKAKLGPDHRDTLWSMIVLGECYAAFGQHEQAVAHFQNARERLAQIHGAQYPLTIWAMEHLAGSYGALGRKEEALKLREEIVQRRKTTFGPDHPETLACMNTLAFYYAELGQVQAAIKLREDLLPFYQKNFGPDHAESLWCLHHLANLNSRVGKVASAYRQNAELYRRRKASLGPAHFDTLQALYQLAHACTALKKHDEALHHFQELFQRLQAQNGPDDQDTLNARCSIVSARIQMKQYDQTLPFLEETLQLTDQARAAKKNISPRLIPQLLLFRSKIYQEKNDPVECQITADRWEKQGLTTDLQFYTASRMRSVAVGAYQKSHLPDRDKQAQLNAEKSLQWLSKSLAAGFKNRMVLERNKDFDAIRERPEFQKLLTTLPPGPLLEQLLGTMPTWTDVQRFLDTIPPLSKPGHLSK